VIQDQMKNDSVLLEETFRHAVLAACVLASDVFG